MYYRRAVDDEEHLTDAGVLRPAKLVHGVIQDEVAPGDRLILGLFDLLSRAICPRVAVRLPGCERQQRELWGFYVIRGYYGACTLLIGESGRA